MGLFFATTLASPPCRHEVAISSPKVVSHGKRSLPWYHRPVAYNTQLGNLSIQSPTTLHVHNIFRRIEQSLGTYNMDTAWSLNCFIQFSSKSDDVETRIPYQRIRSHAPANVKTVRHQSHIRPSKPQQFLSDDEGSIAWPRQRGFYSHHISNVPSVDHLIVHKKQPPHPSKVHTRQCRLLQRRSCGTTCSSRFRLSVS